MFTEEDEYYDAEEMDEDDHDDKDQEDSQVEDEDQQTYFMGTQSQAQKRFNYNRSRPIYRNRPNFNWRQSPYYNPNRDRLQSNSRMQGSLKEHKVHFQIHHKHQKHSHVVLDVDAQIVFK